MRTMVEDHKEDLNNSNVADKAKDADVKKFASQNVPVLKKHTHLDLAQTIQKQVASGSDKTRASR